MFQKTGVVASNFKRWFGEFFFLKIWKYCSFSFSEPESLLLFFVQEIFLKKFFLFLYIIHKASYFCLVKNDNCITRKNNLVLFG